MFKTHLFCLPGTTVFMIHVYAICIWPVKLLLTFSIALDLAWKNIVRCYSHKKCPISVKLFSCLLVLPLTRSMLKWLLVIVDLSVSLHFSQYLFYIFWSYGRCIDSWLVVECFFICFLKFAFVSMLFILNSILSAIKYFTPAFGNFTF